MNYFRKYFSVLTLIFLTFTFKSFIYANEHGDRLERIESQVQDALIQIKGIEKKTKDIPSIKAGPGLKIKSGKNEVKFGGRIHYDLGLHDVDPILSCEMAETEGGSCFTDGTNFRRLRSLGRQWVAPPGHGRVYPVCEKKTLRAQHRRQSQREVAIPGTHAERVVGVHD